MSLSRPARLTVFGLLGLACTREPAPEPAPAAASAGPAAIEAVAFEEDFEPAPERPVDFAPREEERVSAAAQAAEAKAAAGPANDEKKAAPSPSAAGAAPPSSAVPGAGEPSIFATTIATTVYRLPDVGSRRLGYIRLGGRVRRDAEPVPGSGCKKAFYRVHPAGYVCTDEATIDPADPLVRAARKRPDLDKPMPYRYGFVRATSPQYLRVPTAEEQRKSEFKLDEHLDWFRQNFDEVQRPVLGANDVPLDANGIARPGLPLQRGALLTTQLSLNELFGGGPDDSIPWWLVEGRKIPNVSGFEVPDYALFADRVRRKTGLSFVDAFVARDGDVERRFAVTVDMRLIPTTKVKPDTGPMFHGMEIDGSVPLPFAFVVTRAAQTWMLIKGQDRAKVAESVPHRAVIPLSGKARIKEGKRYYQVARDPKRWLRASDIGIVANPPAFPDVASKGKKWIDVSLVQQTLVLYEGMQPVYATLVSTGQDRLGDPKTSKATPRGEFSIRSKHIAAAMDSEENSTVLGGQRAESHSSIDADALATIARLEKAEKEGKKLDTQDQRRLANIKKGRHPEYGVTMRRGSQNYELRDVPWIQYFASGYALHGAYWHDVFGTPRSHGCINLSPIDARRVFRWTDPPLPDGWHGLNSGEELGEGTAVVVRE